MQDFRKNWDKSVEDLADKVDKNPTCQSISKFFETSTLVGETRKYFRENMPALSTFLGKCNNKQSMKISINDKSFILTYPARRMLVFGLSFAPFFFRRRCPIRRYIFWSLILCRENFYLRNYKFYQPVKKNPPEPVKKDVKQK